MKTALFAALSILLVVCSKNAVSCTASTLYPLNAVTASTTSTEPVTITTCNYGGEYAVVILPGAFTWTFTSSISTDYIEITDLSNTTLASGTQPVSYTSTGVDTIRMHIFTNSSCGTQNLCRTTKVARGPCISPNLFPNTTITASASLNTSVSISNCSYAGQYANVYLPAEGGYQFTSSDTSDFIYITTTNDSMIGGGQSPFTVGVSGADTVRMHLFSNSSCGIDSTCRTTSVQKIQCISTSLFPTSTVYTDSSVLTPQTISTCNWAGEYASVYVAGGLTWTFQSSVSTDYFLLTDSANNLIASGTSPFSHYFGSSDSFRLHIFADAGCGEENVCRTTTATRNPCLATFQYPSSMVTAGSGFDTTTISTCNYAGEYALVNLPFPSTWNFFSSNSSDVLILTTVSDSILVSGTGLIEYSSSSTNETLRLHIFSSVLCGTESICRTTGIIRMPCLGVEQYPLNNVSAPTDPEPDMISNCNWGGDYTYVLVDSGHTYQFSSDSSDWYVLTDTSDNYFASGMTPITWTNPWGDTIIKVHIFSDSACGIQQTCRNTYIQCTTCPVPMPTLSSSDSIACLAELPVTLSASNQFSGTVYWYANACGSTPIDSGGSIQVSPSMATWYYVANSYETLLSECDSFYLEVFDSPDVSVTSLSNINCFGDSSGSITVVGSGGVTPYDYVWSTNDSGDAIGNMPAGTYYLTITDSLGCSNTDTFNLLENPEISADLDTAIHLLCFGDTSGAIHFNIAGGVAPYSYSWSNGSNASNLQGVGAGTYTLTITDSAGCDFSVTDSITGPDEIVVDYATTDSDCETDSNGSATATASGGVGSYSYQWGLGSTGSSISDLPSGWYYLTVTDGNACEKADSVMIDHTLPSPIIPLADSGILCEGFKLFLDAGDSGTYSWSTGDTTQILAVDSQGTYSVTVSNSFGCEASSSIEVVQDTCVGIYEETAVNDFLIYPNPTRGELIIEFSKEANWELKIFNNLGALVTTRQATSSQKVLYLNLLQWPRGLYHVELSSESAVYMSKVILQ